MYRQIYIVLSTAFVAASASHTACAQELQKIDMVVFGAPSLGAFLTPIIKARKLDPTELKAVRALYEEYEHALGDFVSTDLGRAAMDRVRRFKSLEFYRISEQKTSLATGFVDAQIHRPQCNLSGIIMSMSFSIPLWAYSVPFPFTG